MRRGAFGIVCLLLAPVAAGVNPTDNDAGSGGDAGDVSHLAILVGPGTHHGQVVWGLDPVDYYAIEAEAGQWLSLSLAKGRPASASVHAPEEYAALVEEDYGGTIPGENITVLLPYSGKWFVVVQPWELDANPVVGYEFDLGLESPESSLVVDPEAPLTTMEFAWDDPARVVMEARLTVRNAPATAQATGMLFIMQAEVAPKFGTFLLSFYVGDQGFGRGLRVEPLGLSGEAPDLEGLFELRATELGGGIIFPWQNQQLTGRVRMTLLHIGDSEASMYFSADVPVRRAIHEDDRVVAWSATSAPAGVALMAPGVSVSGPRELVMEAGRRTFGFFMPWYHEGAVVEPSGTVHSLGPMDSARLYGGVEEGTWRFRINASAGAGPKAESPYLIAAEVPHLGLGPDLTAGLRLRQGEAPWEELLRRLGF